MMKKAPRIWLLLFGAAMVITFAASSALATHPPGTCGDTAHGGLDVPCSCGDTVITNTILDKTDPVTRVVCDGGPGSAALFVDSNVTLDASSAKILCGPRPDGTGPRSFTIGLWIIGSNATIEGGIVNGCAAGVAILAGTSGNTVNGVYAQRGAIGIQVGFSPMQPSNGNTLSDNRCDYNALVGIRVFGGGNTLEGNYCAKNGAGGGGENNGILVRGSGNHLSGNGGDGNRGQGVVADGGGNTTDGTNYGFNNVMKPDCEIDGVSVPGTGGHRC